MNKGVNIKVKGYWQLIIFLCAAAAALIQPYQSVFLREIKNATASQIGIFVSANSIAGIFRFLKEYQIEKNMDCPICSKGRSDYERQSNKSFSYRAGI